MKTDIQIAQEATMLPIQKIAEKLGVNDDELELYGKYKAKITDGFINRMADKPIPTCIRRENGELVHRELTLYRTDYVSDISLRFPKYETAFRYHKCIRDGFIGDAPTQLCDAAGMKETVALIWQNSGGEDPLRGESPIPQKWYCSL